MKFYTTGQIRGKYVINTSPAGGVLFLSPSFEHYDLYNRKKIGYDSYIKSYLHKMRKEYDVNREMWDWLFKVSTPLVFGCDYRQTKVEGSHLPELARILERLGGKYLGHVTLTQLIRKGWIDNEQSI